MTEIKEVSKETANHIEVKGLIGGVIANLLMAVAGWYAYSTTNSDALLLDGNFSFIAAITTWISIFIVRRKHNRTDTFPFGSYFYESFFVFFKGLLILGVTIGAMFENSIKIIDFINGETFEILNPQPILVYSVVMVLICFVLSYYYNYCNKQINGQSSILGVGSKEFYIDGFLSLAVGAALLLTTRVDPESSLSFLLYIGDAIVVILVSLFLIKVPVGIIKNAVIEMGAGVLQNQSEKEDILEKVKSKLPVDFELSKYYISKTGSLYLVVLYIAPTTNDINVNQIDVTRKAIIEDLVLHYQNVEVELVIGNS